MSRQEAYKFPLMDHQSDLKMREQMGVLPDPMRPVFEVAISNGDLCIEKLNNINKIQRAAIRSASSAPRFSIVIEGDECHFKLDC